MKNGQPLLGLELRNEKDLARVLELCDQQTREHTHRVTEITMVVARAMGCTREDLVHIRRGALMHDIGKIAVPGSILTKKGPLSRKEWAIMRRHPIYALELLTPILPLQTVLDMAYCHHERWDGRGYPRGLKAEQIPLFARILAVVDVWDALSSHRPYAGAWSAERTSGYIKANAGIRFDPKITEVFLQGDFQSRLCGYPEDGEYRASVRGFGRADALDPRMHKAPSLRLIPHISSRHLARRTQRFWRQRKNTLDSWLDSRTRCTSAPT